VLTLEEHKQALVVECKAEINPTPPELQEWLSSIKDEAERNGYVGFAFTKPYPPKDKEKYTGYHLPSSYHIDRHLGAGCAGEPPNHPRYFVQSIYTTSGNSPARGPYYYYKGQYFDELEDIDALFEPLPLESERVQEWIKNTFRHHQHCYQDPTIEGSWSDKKVIYPVPYYELKTFTDDPRFSDDWRDKEKAAVIQANGEIIAHALKVATPDNHDATIIIRRYYPEFIPTQELIHNPPQVITSWWEREETRPTPETCKGEDWQPHPVNGKWCQVCGWHEEEAKEMPRQNGEAMPRTAHDGVI
jgi:hypothetical protein